MVALEPSTGVHFLAYVWAQLALVQYLASACSLGLAVSQFLHQSDFPFTLALHHQWRPALNPSPYPSACSLRVPPPEGLALLPVFSGDALDIGFSQTTQGLPLA